MATLELGALVHQIDSSVYQFFNSMRGDWLIDRVVAEEEGNELLKGGIALAAYCYAWFRGGPAQNERRKRIVTVVLATLAAVAIARILAVALPFRVRPMYQPTLPHAAFGTPINPNMEQWSSFPSDTAAYFFGLAFGMFYVLRPLGTPMLLFAAIWVSVPRMYVELHYFTDIAGGATIGILTVWGALQSRWMRGTVARQALQFAEDRPGLFHTLTFLLALEMANMFDGVRSLLHGFRRVLEERPQYATLIVGGTLAVMLLVAGVAAYTIAVRRRRLA